MPPSASRSDTSGSWSNITNTIGAAGAPERSGGCWELPSSLDVGEHALNSSGMETVLPFVLEALEP